VAASTLFATSSISYSGGLLGSAGVGLTISNSYAIGNVSSFSYGSAYSGGLLGSTDVGLTISNSYAMSDVSGSCYKNSPPPHVCLVFYGGVIGQGSGTNVSVYYNDEGASQAVGTGSSAGISSKTSNELRQKNTFIGWDFTNTWAIDSEINNGFPYLKNVTKK